MNKLFWGGLVVLCGIMLTAGCANKPKALRPYVPTSDKEAEAFAKTDFSLTFSQVAKEIDFHVVTDIAWTGIIEDIDFREQRDRVQVALRVREHAFDWIDRGTDTGRYYLSQASAGYFMAGIDVMKPTSIQRLKRQASVGDMIIVYGHPRILHEDGTIQIKAFSVRPIPADQVRFAPALPSR
jgi:hypothetical protein